MKKWMALAAMMRRTMRVRLTCSVLVGWYALTLIGGFEVPHASALGPEELKDSIRIALKEIEQLAPQNGGKTAPDPSLESRISRLEDGYKR